MNKFKIKHPHGSSIVTAWNEVGAKKKFRNKYPNLRILAIVQLSE